MRSLILSCSDIWYQRICGMEDPVCTLYLMSKFKYIRFNNLIDSSIQMAFNWRLSTFRLYIGIKNEIRFKNIELVKGGWLTVSHFNHQAPAPLKPSRWNHLWLNYELSTKTRYLNLYFESNRSVFCWGFLRIMIDATDNTNIHFIWPT